MFFWGRLHPGAVIPWIAVVLIATAVPVVGLLKRRGATVPHGRQLAVLLPAWCALAVYFYAFEVLQGHPTVQLGGGDSWSLLFDSWMPLLVTCLVGVVMSIIGFGAATRTTRPSRRVR